jgi:hypothetical protein
VRIRRQRLRRPTQSLDQHPFGTLAGLHP